MLHAEYVLLSEKIDLWYETIAYPIGTSLLDARRPPSSIRTGVDAVTLLTAFDDVDTTSALMTAVRAHALANDDKSEWSLIAEVCAKQETGDLVDGAPNEKHVVGMGGRYLSPVTTVAQVYHRST